MLSQQMQLFRKGAICVRTQPMIYFVNPTLDIIKFEIGTLEFVCEDTRGGTLIANICLTHIYCDLVNRLEQFPIYNLVTKNPLS
jgi:hypothetical protein